MVSTYRHLRQHIIANLVKIMDPMEARAECNRWLNDGLGFSLSWILANDEKIVPACDLKKVENWLCRRHKGEPWAYIIGWTTFLGRRFFVTHDTLIPRPETELVVALALEVGRQLKVSCVYDIGTGSGIIAISMALATDWQVVATDISKKALDVARKNASNLKADISYYHSDLLDTLPDYIEFVVSNPPYIALADKNTLQRELAFEPQSALFASNNGLAIVIRLLRQAYMRSVRGCVIEIGSGQGSYLKDQALAIGWHFAKVYKDLADHDRVLVVY